MQDNAKFWIISAALGWYGCAGSVVDEPPRRPTLPGSSGLEDPYNVIAPRAGNAGVGGQSGRAGGGASSSGSAGRVAEAGRANGGMGPSPGLAGAGSSPAGGSAGSGIGGAPSVPSADCPSPTRARLANGTCVERVTEFSVAVSPSSITTGSDGRIWFHDGKANQLVQLDDQGRVLAQIKLAAGENVRHLVPGSGNVILWYSDWRAKTLTSLNDELKQASIPLEFSPEGLARGERHDQFWLTEAGKAVYRVDLSNSTTTRYPAAPTDAITIGPDNNVWFPEGTEIARQDPMGDKQNFRFTDSFADDICAGPDGALWFIDGSLNQVGRMLVDGTFIRTYDAIKNGHPQRIIAGPDGALWFTLQAAEMIGRITVDGVLTHYPLPPKSGPSGPQAITVGPDNNIWFTEFFSGKIGRLIPDPVK
ncbi:MAG TPA: hypothetical protein VJV79_22555 [Polyangiaceae bacterium]|nr:hypothetical protein [Polyangiaceae bacterium]